jgi:hypothetical protein
MNAAERKQRLAASHAIIDGFVTAHRAEIESLDAMSPEAKAALLKGLDELEAASRETFRQELAKIDEQSACGC